MEKHRSAAREPNERIIVGEDPSSSRSQAKNPRFSLESLVERHSEANVGVSAKSVAEVHAYLSTPASSVTNDILDFWRLNGKLWPNLMLVAQAVFSIPATSTPVERLFSSAGNIITAKRSAISPTLLDMLVFIHDNYDVCKNVCLNASTYGTKRYSRDFKNYVWFSLCYQFKLFVSCEVLK